jgi:hypothetical protein
VTPRRFQFALRERLSYGLLPVLYHRHRTPSLTIGLADGGPGSVSAFVTICTKTRFRRSTLASVATSLSPGQRGRGCKRRLRTRRMPGGPDVCLEWSSPRQTQLGRL